MTEDPKELVVRPITMQDVRLAVGEGKLTPADILTGCNAELKRRFAHMPRLTADRERSVPEDVVIGKRSEMPTIWEDPAGKGYPCFERPMTAKEAADTVREYGRRIAEYENERTAAPEDVVERVARALAKHNYPGASERYIDEMWDGWAGDARAAIAATPPPEKVGNANLSVLKGFALVPVVPTEAMIDRFVSRALCVSVHGEGGWSNYAREQWATMIAAAPAPALPETGVERTPRPADQKGTRA